MESPAFVDGDAEDTDAEESDAELEVAELLELEHEATTSGAMSATQSESAATRNLGDW